MCTMCTPFQLQCVPCVPLLQKDIEILHYFLIWKNTNTWDSVAKCTLWINRIEHRGNGLHQLGQPMAPSILFPVFNPPYPQGTMCTPPKDKCWDTKYGRTVILETSDRPIENFYSSADNDNCRCRWADDLQLQMICRWVSLYADHHSNLQIK